MNTNEINGINSFTFYWDYYYLIDTMPAKDKKELVVAILDYVFKDEIPNLNGHNQAIFNTLSKQINKSKNKSNNARKENQTEIKLKSNENQNEIKKGNKTSVLSFKFLVSNFIFNNFKFLDSNNKTKIENKILDWIKYKQERKEVYKETGLKSLLKQIENNTQKYGVDVISDLIDDCMANNYKGIIFDKLNNKKIQEKIPTAFKEKIEEDTATDEEMKKLEERLYGGKRI